MKTIQIPATIEGVSTLKDGSMSIRLHSQEMSVEQKVVLMEFVQKFGWLLFRENQFTDEDIPDRDAELDEKKSLSERLRAVIIVEGQQKGIPRDELGSYYRKEMEKRIQEVKNKLN